MRPRSRLFLVFYATSGAAALVYEITWTRLLTLLMGHTVAAAATVLAAIMGGLAVGAWMGGRLGRRWADTDRDARALRAYAALEIFVAAAALALPFFLRALTPLLAWAYEDGQAPLRFGLARAALAMLLVGLPATAMGATFPVAVAWYADVAADAGLLYAVNTAGAAIGAFSTGFYLIPAIGLQMTTWVGVALNLVAAGGAAWLAAQAAPVPGAAANAPRGVAADDRAAKRRKKTVPTGRRPAAARAPAAPGLAAAAAAASGFCALVYEVAWTRLVALVIGPTTYAFATVAAAFIIGLALGASVGSRLVRRVARPAVWLGAALLLTAAAASTAGWFAATELPLVVAGQVAAADASFAPIVTRQVAGIVLLLLPMTFALGAAFPLALATAAPRHADVGAASARVYAANTLGAIAGSLAGGFALLPLVGLHGTMRVASGAGLLAAAAVWAAEMQGRAAGIRPWLGRAAGLASALALLVLLPAWDLNLFSGGVYKYAPYISVADLENELRTWRLLFHEDGATATVSVRELAGQRSLVIDGKVDASNAGDMLTERLLGLLPAVVHGHPRDVLVLGLGSGVTAGAVLATGTVRSADVVEISPEVVAASRFFARENGGVLQAPAVRLVAGDGRSHLAFTPRRYDVIISEPSNPWMAGIAALFTREFFETARARLTPDGVICQWAHTYDISRDDLRSIVGTFGSVFPQSTMWLVGDGDLLLVGTNGPSIDAHVGGLAAGLGAGTAPRLLEEVGVARSTALFSVLSLLAGGPAEVERYGAGAAIQTDDRMALEFSAARAIFGRSVDDNAADIRRLAGEPPLSAARSIQPRASDAAWAAAGAMQLKADGYNAAYDAFRRALRVNGSNPDALRGLADAASGAGRPDEARAALEAIASAEPGNANVRIELSRVTASGGNLERAATLAADAARLAPGDPRAGEQLASVFADAGDGNRLTLLSDDLVARFPGRDMPHYYRAQALLLKQRAREAVAEIRPVAARAPSDVRVQNLFGIACATSGDRACAEAAFAAALAASPRDAPTYVNLGVFYLQSAPGRAAEAFQTALTIDRTSSPARQGLAEARGALGRR